MVSLLNIMSVSSAKLKALFQLMQFWKSLWVMVVKASFDLTGKQVKLMWTPEALSLFMIDHPYLDSLNDVEIYNALKNYSRL